MATVRWVTLKYLLFERIHSWEIIPNAQSLMRGFGVELLFVKRLSFNLRMYLFNFHLLFKLLWGVACNEKTTDDKRTVQKSYKCCPFVAIGRTFSKTCIWRAKSLVPICRTTHNSVYKSIEASANAFDASVWNYFQWNIYNLYSYFITSCGGSILFYKYMVRAIYISSNFTEYLNNKIESMLFFRKYYW